MQDVFTRRGLPLSLELDAWWMEATPSDTPWQDGQGGGGGKTAFSKLGKSPRLYLFAFVIAVADFLFWHQAIGLSLVLFALLIFIAAAADDCSIPQLLRSATLLVLACLPTIEFIQPLSVAFLVVGLILSVGWARMPDMAMSGMVEFVLGWLRHVPMVWKTLALRLFGRAKSLPQNPNPSNKLRMFLRDWALPLGGLLVFSALLLQANPILLDWVLAGRITEDLIIRALFWTGIALAVWPFFDPSEIVPVSVGRSHRKLPSLGVNARSIRISVVVFNLIIGVQTSMDVSILWFGADLPQGMTYAEYAHRGAYPLLATAILAGLFALAARPFLDEHRIIRPLIYLWLAQNIALCLSSVLRTELYIQEYGLTYLRVRALIWMGLVAIGLAMLAWQAARSKSNAWLLTRVVLLGLATLYVCSFVNFAQLIAQTNIAMGQPDYWYLCTLGPMANGPLIEPASLYPGNVDWPQYGECDFDGHAIEGWRDWGLRKWRVTNYVEAELALMSVE